MKDHISVLWLRTSLWPTFHWSLLHPRVTWLAKEIEKWILTAHPRAPGSDLKNEHSVFGFASQAMLFASYPGSSAQNPMWSFHSCLAINKGKWMPSLSGQGGRWTLPFQTVIQGQEDMFPSQDGEKFSLQNSQAQTWQITSCLYFRSSLFSTPTTVSVIQSTLSILDSHQLKEWKSCPESH